MRALVIAAGRGRRLLPLTERRPKPLVRVNGQPLLEYAVDNLRRAGITDIIIVVGYQGDLIRRYFGDGTGFGVNIRYAVNQNYERGNATSVLAAEPFLEDGEPFFLLMADHLIERSMLERAMDCLDQHPLLCVDRNPQHPPQLKDATRVLVDEAGYIRNIGKQIRHYNGVDTGVFILNRETLRLIRSVPAGRLPLTLSRCFRRMIREGWHLWACDVSGMLWLDIDTSEDLSFAEELLTSIL